MTQPQFLITHVAARQAGLLELTFADGFSGTADLTEAIDRHPVLKPLRDQRIFARVGLDEWHRGVLFADDDALTLASDNLRALIIEQAGDTSHSQVIAWMSRHGLTLESAAQALGISRRMLAYYRSGEKSIPKTVGLAMLGWEVQQTAAA